MSTTRLVWKYPLAIANFQNVQLPIGAQILTIQNQNENPFLWALVDPTEDELEPIAIELFGTGHPINIEQSEARRYISTFQMADGQLVYHAFERTDL